MASAEGRRGSVISAQYASGERVVKEEVGHVDVFPANEEIAKAVQQKVAAAVEMARKYRHVGWYASFVAAYMIILYFQASAYKSGDVVQTLKKAFLPSDGSTSLTFRTGEELLEYIGQKVLLPIWRDPVCGDGTCQEPWEFPAWGRFGCRADCGVNLETYNISLFVKADFTRHPTISARTLMSAARYNLCLKDEARRARGEADLCWFQSDLGFSDTQPQVLHRAQVIAGEWYVSVKGDFTGRVEGQVHDISENRDYLNTDDDGASSSGLSFSTKSNHTNTGPIELKMEPEFKACKIDAEASTRRRLASSSSPAIRRLLEMNDKGKEVGGMEGLKIIERAIKEAQKLIKKQASSMNLDDMMG